jgi:hypothetical protein
MSVIIIILEIDICLCIDDYQHDTEREIDKDRDFKEWVNLVRNEFTRFWKPANTNYVGLSCNLKAQVRVVAAAGKGRLSADKISSSLVEVSLCSVDWMNPICIKEDHLLYSKY